MTEVFQIIIVLPHVFSDAGLDFAVVEEVGETLPTRVRRGLGYVEVEGVDANRADDGAENDVSEHDDEDSVPECWAGD